jgi:hypothetical protein
MNNKIKLLSSKSSPQMEKEAIWGAVAQGARTLLPMLGSAARSFFPRLGSTFSNLASRKDFLGGFAAPVTKFTGGLQKAYGYGQQGVAAMRQGLGSSVDDLMKNPLYQRGAKNVAGGSAMREQAGLLKGLKAPNSWSYRAGRGIGSVAVGAPLFSLPFTAAEYAGAASADPAIAEEYAKNMAYQRVQDRLNEFQNMPFLDRAKAVFNPEGLTQQMQAPEAAELYQAIGSGNTESPGLLKYLSGFNPFLGSPSEVVNQKVRSEMFNALNKSGSEKQAMVGQILKGLGAAWKAGRGAAGAATRGATKGVQSLTTSGVSRLNTAPGVTNIPIWEAALQKGMYQAGKSPLGTLGAAAAVGLTPFTLKSMYDSGNRSVYDAAANNAMGMADLQLLSKFNQPGFMGGLGRAGFALAPGLVSDMVLKQVRQSMFPEVNQQQY